MFLPRVLPRCLLLLAVNGALASPALADDRVRALSQRSKAVRRLDVPFPLPTAFVPRADPLPPADTKPTDTKTDPTKPTDPPKDTKPPADPPKDTKPPTDPPKDTKPPTDPPKDTKPPADPPKDTDTPPKDTNTPPTDTNTPPKDTNTTPTDTNTPPKETPTDTETEHLTTDSNGVVKTVTETRTNAPPTNSPQTDTTDTKPKEKGISTSTIIGISVAGGVALIAVVAFVIWKFTRKRFTDDDFDNEAIKWPDLNAHGESGGSHALPATRTGGAGFETSSQVNLTRPDSRAGSVAPSSESQVNLYAAHDPYAVPPPPHLNPGVGQPYRDDPNAPYYDHDPYAPQDAYPMTQIRARSPGPALVYGRASPAPAQAYGIDPRTMSPAPYAGGMGAPQAGRMSPGPQMAYGGGYA